MAKVKSDTSFNRVQFDTFRVEAGLIQQNVKTAEKFGHSNIFATLSLSLRYSPTIAFPLYTARAGARIDGFPCFRAREAAVLFIPYSTNK